MTAAEGVVYGDYYLMGRLAQGGMAEVFLAKSLRRKPEGLLALKRTLSEYSSEEDFISMFTDEARIASGLAHPNICQIHDHGQIGDQRFLVMEFIHGKDLKVAAHRARQRKEPIPEQLAVYIVARIADALHVAHRKTNDDGDLENIVHRDISPQNILISYDGVPKLIDFGIAKAKDRLVKTQAGVVKGKFAYMSPEQAIGTEVDFRTDIFALGVVLYELLVGELPFKGSSDFSTLKRVAKAEYHPPPTDKVPPRLVKIIQTCLTRQPEGRFSSASEMAAELDRYLTETHKQVNEAALSTYMRKLFRDDYTRELGKIKEYLAIEPPAPPRVTAIGLHDLEDRTTRRQTLTRDDPHKKDTRDLQDAASSVTGDDEATRITSSAELAAGFELEDEDEVTGLSELLEPNLEEVDADDVDEAEEEEERSTAVGDNPFDRRSTAPDAADGGKIIEFDDQDDEPTQMTEFSFAEDTREVEKPYGSLLPEIIDTERADDPPAHASFSSPLVEIDEAIDVSSDDLLDAPLPPVAKPVTKEKPPVSKPVPAPKKIKPPKPALGGSAGLFTRGEIATLVGAGFVGMMVVLSTYYVTRHGVPPFAVSLRPAIEKLTGQLPEYADDTAPPSDAPATP